MNYSTAIFLINPRVRAIACIYEPDPATGKIPTRTVFKTFDTNIKVEDFVIVPTGTRHKMTISQVVEVDVRPNLDSDVQMDWIIGTVDRRAYEIVLAEEGRVIAIVRDSEENAKREELAKKVFAHVNKADLDRLKITSMGEPETKPNADDISSRFGSNISHGYKSGQ